MRPSSLWRYRGPIVRWGVFSLALATIAAGLYVMLPPEPRWELVREPSDVFDVGGSRIASYHTAEGRNAGPLHLLDGATGSEIAQFLSDAPTLHNHAHSEDGRYFVALVPGERPSTWRIRGVDLQEQREWQTDAVLEPFASAIFSPRCDYVALRLKSANDKEQPYVVRRTSDGRVVAQDRIPAAADRVAFSRNGGAFVLAYQHEENANHIRAINTATAQAATLDSGSLLAVGPDAGSLVADRGDEGIWVADLANGAWRCRLEHARVTEARQRWERTVAVRYLLALNNRQVRIHARSRRTAIGLWSHLGAVRMRTGANIWLDLGDSGEDGPIFSADGQRVLWQEAPEASSRQLVCYHVQTGKPRWRRTWPISLAMVRFTPDSRRLVVRATHAGEAEVIDAATGATERTIEFPELAGQDAALACDGRTLTATLSVPEPEPFWLWAKILEWLPDRPEPGPLMTVRVFDFATGERIGAVTCEETSEWWLTDDRRGLIAVYQESDESAVVQTVIRCWDIAPQHPLRWVLGVPLALGVALVALRSAWRRWRQRRKFATPAQAAPAPG